MPANANHPIDAVLLLKLRLAVARHGEMDVAGWWNTKGVLSRVGKAGLSRGFPSTHFFAQARVVFAVATARCQEVFSPPNCYTLWVLPPETEEAIDSQWQVWCRNPEPLFPFFETVAKHASGTLIDLLTSLDALDAPTRAALAELKLSSQGKGVLLPGIGAPDNATLMLLAAAFSHGGKGSLAVPYLRVE